jgi:hypothetical protein
LARALSRGGRILHLRFVFTQPLPAVPYGADRDASFGL